MDLIDLQIMLAKQEGKTHTSFAVARLPDTGPGILSFVDGYRYRRGVDNATLLNTDRGLRVLCRIAR